MNIQAQKHIHRQKNNHRHKKRIKIFVFLKKDVHAFLKVEGHLHLSHSITLSARVHFCVPGPVLRTDKTCTSCPSKLWIIASSIAGISDSGGVQRYTAISCPCVCLPRSLCQQWCRTTALYGYILCVVPQVPSLPRG